MQQPVPQSPQHSNNARIAQAEKHMAEGLEYESTTWLRWSPDWDLAIAEYEKAANLYRAAGVLDKAKSAYLKSANARTQMKQPVAASKAYETAASIAKEAKRNVEAANLYERASLCIRETGISEKAAQLLVLAAKTAEPDDAGRALELYLSACDLFEIDNKEYYGLDTFRQAMAAAIKANQFEVALGLAERLSALFERNKRTHDLFKSYLTAIVFHLQRNDLVAADNAYKKYLSTPGFPPSDESRAAGHLLEAWEANDQTALNACLKAQTFEFLDPAVGRLARRLKVSPSLT